MDKFLSFFILALVISLGAGTLSSAADLDRSGSQIAPTLVVTMEGELIAIEGDMYVLKDRAGKEFGIHVDNFTAVIGHVEPGVWVEAKVTAETGHAETIKVMKAS